MLGFIQSLPRDPANLHLTVRWQYGRALGQWNCEHGEVSDGWRRRDLLKRQKGGLERGDGSSRYCIQVNGEPIISYLWVRFVPWPVAD